MAKRRSRKFDIRIGECDWIQGSRPDRAVTPASMDAHLVAIAPLFDALETSCIKECCGLRAFGLQPREIERALVRQDVRLHVDGLRVCIAAIDGMGPDVVCSRFLQEPAREKKQILEILRHVLHVCEGLP